MKKLFLAFCLMATVALAQSQNVMTQDLLWQLGRVGGETLTPDGLNVIYGISNPNMSENKSERNLYSIPLAGGQPKQITTTAGTEYNVVKTPSGKMGYLYKGQFWEADWDGSNAKQISNTVAGIDNVKFSPDGKFVLFTRDVKMTKSTQDLYPSLDKSSGEIYDDLMYRHWNEWEDGYFSHVFVAKMENGTFGNGDDIMSGEAFDCPQKPDGGAEDITWSPDSKNIVYVCKKLSGKQYAISTNSDIYNYNLATANTTNLTAGMMGYDVQPNFSSDGKFLAWLSMDVNGYEADKYDVILYDYTTTRKINLTKDWDETVSGSIMWSNDNKLIYLTTVIEGTDQLFSIALEKNPENANAKDLKQITSGDWDINGMIGQSANTMVVSRTDMNHAAELFTVDLTSGNMKPLTHTNESIYNSIKTSKIEKRWVNTTDGKKELVWVIYPPDFDASKKYPTLLYCQGGPQSAVSQFYSFRWNFQLMAAHGYIVVAPNRRGLPGFGVKWNEQISGDWGGQAIKDYLSAIDSISNLPFVDKTRLGAVGASYGGYSVYMLEGVSDGRFKTMIAHCGLFDLNSWYLTTEEMWFANYDVGGNFLNSPTDFTKPNSNNPLTFASNWQTPILVIEGGLDFRVPMNQGFEAYQLAQLKGIKSRLLYFPDEGHWILQPQNGMLWQNEFYRWLSETL